jgi:hypothetical protein
MVSWKERTFPRTHDTSYTVNPSTLLASSERTFHILHPVSDFIFRHPELPHQPLSKPQYPNIILTSHLLVIAVRHTLLRIMRATRRAAEGLELPTRTAADLDPVEGGVTAVGLTVAEVCGREDGYGGGGRQAGDGEEGEEFGEHCAVVCEWSRGEWDGGTNDVVGFS